MRITLDLQENILKEVYAYYNTKTKTEAINNALSDWVRIQRKQALLDLRGNVDIDDLTELQKKQEIGELNIFNV